ncbi:recombinase family protein [Paenibacillus sp. 7541]|uniref:recombinase family protein n=1 Tax=Paenibacillus sp. 7541 TaxID=2026236 RepID=UPI001C3E8C03
MPDEALIVRKIFELYAAGRGLKSIANELIDPALHPSQSPSIDRPAIKRLYQ